MLIMEWIVPAYYVPAANNVFANQWYAVFCYWVVMTNGPVIRGF